MKFVAISDTHLRHHKLRLPKGDVLLHAGDFTYKGRQTETVEFINWLASTKYKYKIFIAGNHEFFLEKANAAYIQSLLPEGVIYLNDSGVEIEGIKIWGSPVTPWFHNWAFNRHRGPMIDKHWKLIPADTDVLITHGPAYGMLDSVGDDRHIGCRNLWQRVQQVKPKVHVFGHIHEAYGSEKVNGTKYINASMVNDEYELVNKPIVFDLKK